MRLDSRVMSLTSSITMGRMEALDSFYPALSRSPWKSFISQEPICASLSPTWQSAWSATTPSFLRCHCNLSLINLGSIRYLLTRFVELSVLLIFLFGTCAVLRQRREQEYRCDWKCFASQRFTIHCHAWKHLESHCMKMEIHFYSHCLRFFLPTLLEQRDHTDNT